MIQAEATRVITKLATKVWLELHGKMAGRPRYIPIVASPHMEAGLPDLMILTPDQRLPNGWWELKRDWDDKPRRIQRWNVELSLPDMGYHTGYCIGHEFKHRWDDEHAIPTVQAFRELFLG